MTATVTAPHLIVVDDDRAFSPAVTPLLQNIVRRRLGRGLRRGQIAHAAVSDAAANPLEHARVRKGLGLRPGALELLLSRALVAEVIYNQKRRKSCS